MRIVDDALAVEEPLEIRVNSEPLAVTMRTPGHDLELAAGFCLTEGVIAHGDDLESVMPCDQATHGNAVLVTLTQEALAARAEQLRCARRESYLSSSCGLCGKVSIDRVRQRIGLLDQSLRVSRATLEALPGVMRQAQATFDATGGLHAASLFDAQGNLLVLREDVGRHNAADKVIGQRLLLGRVPARDAMLLISGRASFEIVQKAAMAGVQLLAAVSAPSSLAVSFAKETGMTLVGFLRPGRMNIYHDIGRVD